MLKKLQRKFFVIAMFALAAVVLVQSFSVNAIHIYQRDSEVKNILKVIADNNGVLPNTYIPPGDNFAGILNPFLEMYTGVETPYSTRYFAVHLSGNIVTNISTEHIAAIDDKAALEYTAQVCSQAPGFGFIDVYRYYYVRQGPKAIIVFMDFQKELMQTFALASISFMVSMGTLVILLVFVYWLSKKAMKPVADSIEKQKQFITDASHELKTPISIISADAEVLEMLEGENEWLTSIKNQTVRMNHLVKNLVDLAKLNEMHDDSSKTFFDLSKAVLETAQSFEGVAQIAGKTYNYSAAAALRYYGNEQEIRQLVTILCDNAIKYTDENGSIKLTVYKSGKNHIIEITNTCEFIDQQTVSRLFDRFYRADTSRVRKEKTGGYGIGLSIAKAITDRHKGKIRVVTNGNKSITFKVIL